MSFYRCLSMGKRWKTSAEIIKTKCQVVLYKKIGSFPQEDFPILCRIYAVLLIGTKTMMTIIPEKSAYCCRWARKLEESFYVINGLCCFRNTANFSGIADRSSP